MNPYLIIGLMAGFVFLALSTSLSSIITTRGLMISVLASMVPLAAGWGIMWTLGAAVVGYVAGS